MSSVFEDVKRLTKKYYMEWKNTTPDISFLPKYTLQEKNKKNGEITKFLNELLHQINLINNESDKHKWQHNLKSIISNKARQFLKINDKTFEDIMISGFLDATDDFISKARQFDKNIKFEDIYQAMRNVWIMNIIQVLANKKVACTPSVFAYSMLYPYTDNFLDNPDIPENEKNHLTIDLSTGWKANR